MRSGDDNGRASGSSGRTHGKPSCLMNLIASVWVDFFHAAFAGRKYVEQENEMLRMSAVRRDLDTCYSALQVREVELHSKVQMLGRQAVMYKQGKNLAGARKKMLERARCQGQLEKIQNSILMIDMHRSTIEGTSLDLTVLEALKASGDALRQMGATGDGLKAVEGLVSTIEESMQSAAEITTVLSSGSVSGMVNTMATYGVAVDEEELMRELDQMTLSPVGEQEEDEEEAKDIGKLPPVPPVQPDEPRAKEAPSLAVVKSGSKLPRLAAAAACRPAGGKREEDEDGKEAEESSLQQATVQF